MVLFVFKAEDRRLKRLEVLESEGRQRPTRHRHIVEPEILMEESESEGEQVTMDHVKSEESEEEEEDEQEDATAKTARRLELKKKALQRQEELLAVEEEQKGSDSDSSEESDEYEDEEYTDSEDEIAPRLKPVFVRK